MRKKNLIDFLKCVDLGFEKNSCFNCIYNEKDELDNGRPICETENKCKHFAHIKKTWCPSGNPNEYLFANGIQDFYAISEKIINLSSWDGANLPTVSFYQNAVGKVGIDEELFQDLLSIKLNHIRRNIIDERIRTAQRGSRI